MTGESVLVAFSNDAGETFGDPIPLDGPGSLGRVDVTLLADGTAIVVWLARMGREGVLRAAAVDVTGAVGAATTIARCSADRRVGFPQIVASGDGALVAWTDPDGEPAGLRAVLLSPAR